MGHTLRAIVGKAQPVAQLARNWRLARLVVLPQGFALVPVTTPLHQDIIDLFAEKLLKPHDDLALLSAALERVIRDASHGAQLAYIETDYFGGIGTQSAIGWENGAVACGPFGSNSNERPINTVLAWMGTIAYPGSDEFDALTLGRFRDTHSTAERYGKPVFG